jgi:hypothetical protein
MKPDLHLAKARRFIATKGRLDPVEDYEAIMWANMHICTHWINAIFHAGGLTSEKYDFEHTWHLDRCPDRERLLAGLKDKKQGGEMQTLLDILTAFEGLRTTYVRGPGPYGADFLGRSEDDVARVRRIAERVFTKL